MEDNWSNEKQERLKNLAAIYAETEATYLSLKVKLEYYQAQILAELPEEPSEYDIALDGCPYASTVKVRIPEKRTWDIEGIKNQFNVEGIIPDTSDVVQSSTTWKVDNRKYDKASDEVKAELKPFLTVECGKPTFKISE